MTPQNEASNNNRFDEPTSAFTDAGGTGVTQQQAAVRAEGATLEPVQPNQRLRELDVLRGFAIFGILMVNIAFFAAPMGYAVMPGEMPGGMTIGAKAAYSIMRGLFELKFVGLFSMMFGMGMVIQFHRAQRAGKPFTSLYLRRISVLAVFGLSHALLLWYGDILFVYSWLALAAMLFVRKEAATLLKVAAAGLALSVVCLALLTALQVAAAEVQGEAGGAKAPGTTETIEPAQENADGGEQKPAAGAAVQTPVQQLIEIFRGMGDDPNGGAPNSESWVKAETMAYAEGPMPVTLIVRAVMFAMMFVVVLLNGFLFRALAMFLIGMALVKMRFFDKERHELVRKVFRICLPLGLLGEGAGVAAGLMTGFSQGWHSLAIDVVHWVASVLVTLGYAAGIVLLCRSGALPALIRGLEGVGRTALSNYLLQTLIATTIFYWWGFGLFGKVSPPLQLLTALAIFTAQMIGTWFWLRYFRIGPMEWLWRSLTYKRMQPLRLQPNA